MPSFLLKTWHKYTTKLVQRTNYVARPKNNKTDGLCYEYKAEMPIISLPMKAVDIDGNAFLPQKPKVEYTQAQSL